MQRAHPVLWIFTPGADRCTQQSSSDGEEEPRTEECEAHFRTENIASEEQPHSPVSPRSQALFDSDLMNSVLACTVERCLAAATLQGPHAAFFRTDPADDEPAHKEMTSSFSFEDDDATSSDSWGHEVHSHSSPTSAVWADWDLPTCERSPGKKRTRDELDGDVQNWPAKGVVSRQRQQES